MSDVLAIVISIVVGVVCVVGASIILSGRDSIGEEMVMEEWRASRDGRKK